MNVLIEKLLVLQKLDVEIHEIRTSAKVYPDQLQAAQTQEQKARQSLETTKAQLTTLENEHVTGSQTLELEDSRLKKSRLKLKTLKTPYEFQALNREIQNTERANEELQEKLLGMMTQMETLKKSVAVLEEDWKKAKEALEKVEGEVGVKTAEFDGVLKTKLDDQKKLQSDIDRAILSKYLFIQKKYKDVVVSVVSGSCQGCYRNIPPQMFNEMLKSKDLNFCPNCQRMIYVAEPPASGNA